VVHIKSNEETFALPNRIPPYFQLEEHQISPEDVTRLILGCEPELIQPRVVFLPYWRAEVFSAAAGAVTEIVPGRVHQVAYQGQAISLVRSGIGAPQAGDMVLALGCTPCEMLVFAGSAGGLANGLNIGDLFVVEKSICGDGYSRYLEPEVLPGDRFLQTTTPDQVLSEILERRALEVCQARSTHLDRGSVFSTDSILAQFFRLEALVDELECAAIEMETAAVFNAARLVGIRAAALLQISDLPRQGKSLFAGRTEAEMQRRRSIRQDVLAPAVLSALLAS